jgi:hypothetical membrane protein
MQASQMVKTFTDRFPFVGPIFWMASVQYLVVQLVVAAAWAVPFSLSQNTISDLGNTACGQYGKRFVCSPQHSLMNASFIVLGTTMMVGAALIYQEFKETDYSLVGFSFMGLAGLGSVLVGAFPENTVSALHILGAFLPFLIGNLGLLVLGLFLDIPKSLRYYTLASGAFGLVALGLFLTGHYLGLGIGGMERATAYPQTVWLIIFGVYMSSNHIRQQIASKP